VCFYRGVMIDDVRLFCVRIREVPEKKEEHILVGKGACRIVRTYIRTYLRTVLGVTWGSCSRRVLRTVFLCIGELPGRRTPCIS